MSSEGAMQQAKLKADLASTEAAIRALRERLRNAEGQARTPLLQPQQSLAVLEEQARTLRTQLANLSAVEPAKQLKSSVQAGTEVGDA